MRKLLKIAAVSSLAIGLAACHTAQNANPNAGAGAPGAPGAQTYPLGQKGGLEGANVSGGGENGMRHVNSLRAPSNQVYYFGFNQSIVSSADARAATIQANYLVTHRNARVRLEGNTDDRGSREYNVALGWRRAQAVARILKQQGVSPSQIKMVSYGKEHPVASGDSEQSRSLNRRVELIYVAK